MNLFSFVRNHQNISQVTLPLCILTSNEWEFLLLHILSSIGCSQCSDFQFSSVQSINGVWLFATPWTAADQASLSITNSQSLLKLMSIELVMPSNHLSLLFQAAQFLHDSSTWRRHCQGKIKWLCFFSSFFFYLQNNAIISIYMYMKLWDLRFLSYFVKLLQSSPFFPDRYQT